MGKVRGKDKSMNRKWKDRNRVYLLLDTCYDIKILIETERSVDRLFKMYKQSPDHTHGIGPFVVWMKEMELCKIIEYEEFKV